MSFLGANGGGFMSGGMGSSYGYGGGMGYSSSMMNPLYGGGMGGPMMQQ